MENKKSAGRQKIPLAKIEKEATRYSSFSKRRCSLYEKASKLVRECDVDLGIVMFSPKGKPYSLVHPTSNAVIDRFINPTAELSAGDQMVAEQARKKVTQNNNMLNEFEKREKNANEKILFFDQMNETRDKGWWEFIDQFNKDDATKYDAWLTSGEFMLKNQLKQLENGASSSSQFPPDDANNSSKAF
ncbi:agamous-like MADS-box protein AGL29 [Solanum dulcamara]|uniref:agamous-like MADS-box protein AGL29 n=1 Tax=Solanum dulcamara TaxID=45834 RepID=UPI0024869290|nr:agamous-like MADS-box protein AGL29 [Solanum dulcamara]